MASAQRITVPQEIKVRNLPAPAEFLYQWLTYFVETSDEDIEVHKAKPTDFESMYNTHFRDDAVVEFPYLPRAYRTFMPVQALTVDEEDGGKLVGRQAIINYFGPWRSTFWFSHVVFKTLHVLGDTSKGVVEARVYGKLLNESSPRDYIQDYVSFVELDDQGKVVVYREHWAANRFA